MSQREEQRKHARTPVSGEIKIFTSVVNTAYTVQLANVSRGGVFIRSRHLPILGETITYQVLDAAGVKVASGQGTVVRLVTQGQENDLGFGVSFDLELDLTDEQHLLDAPGNP